MQLADVDLTGKIKAAVAGMTHGEREWFGMELASIASGDEVQLLKCDRNTMTAWVELKPAGKAPASGAMFTDAQKALIERCEMKPADVMRHMPAPTNGAARREREATRMRDAEAAGPLDAAETGEMKSLTAKATAGTLAPDKQPRLLALLDRCLATRGGGR